MRSDANAPGRVETARVVVITGASGGIGAALAALLARKGDTVVLVARRAEALQALAAKIGRLAIASRPTSRGVTRCGASSRR
jgi:NADP-dependent 3-hydroxy acid dehydrogenase YdfG